MHLRRTLRNVSRTFAISIEQLPLALREAVTIAYLLFRVSDCLENSDDLEASRKADLLRLWAQVLEGNTQATSLTKAVAHLDENDPEVFVAQHADQLLKNFIGFPNRSRK